jgi:hypothetical protein
MNIEGLTFERIEGMSEHSDSVTFYATNGSVWNMYHDQECCESVYLADVVGDPEDLIGSPILTYEEVVNSDDNLDVNGELLADGEDSHTWTFYKFQTAKGAVTLRWFGSSNGYYSESVTFEESRN